MTLTSGMAYLPSAVRISPMAPSRRVSPSSVVAASTRFSSSSFALCVCCCLCSVRISASLACASAASSERPRNPLVRSSSAASASLKRCTATSSLLKGASLVRFQKTLGPHRASGNGRKTRHAHAAESARESLVIRHWRQASLRALDGVGTRSLRALSRARRHYMESNKTPPDQAEIRRLANAIRGLTMDAVQTAKSGHPGLPMGMADATAVLFSRFLKFDPADPHWPDRDRFVLSAGHGSMLLYSLLYLLGFSGPTRPTRRR